MPQYINTEELLSLAGTELEPSEWLQITQERINEFADATNDHQFIHVDVEKAKKTAFGGTIAHGFLTLSLLTWLISEKMAVPKNTVVTINYGSDKVRFLKPVLADQRIRAKQSVLAVNEKKPRQWLIKMNVTIEIEGEETPALISEILFMHIVGG